MRAIIMAGGKGRRLEPYTITFPKPLVPVDDMPVVEIVVRQLRLAGFDRLTFAVGHLAELVMAYFQDGSRWGVEIDYSREFTPLGTIGPLGLVADLPEDFLVMNADILTTLPYDDLFDFHVHSEADLTIATHRRDTKIDLGVIEFNEDRQVTGYREKPSLSYDVSMGIYVCNRSVLELIEPNTRVDFPDIVMQLVARGGNVMVYQSDDEWLDIGRIDDYARATETFRAMRHHFLPERPEPRVESPDPEKDVELRV